MKDEFKLMRKVNDEWIEVEAGKFERIQDYEPEFSLMRMLKDESQWVWLTNGILDTCQNFQEKDETVYIAKYKIVPRGTFIY
jgi:hypothetical protein